MNLHRLRGEMLLMTRRSNCLVYALLTKYLHPQVRLRVRRSPDFPLLPRISLSWNGGLTWHRFMHAEQPRKDGWRRWLPLHALWFIGTSRRDLT